MRTVLLPLFLIAFLVSRAQNKITGIGPFQVKTTTVDIIGKISVDSSIKIVENDDLTKNRFSPSGDQRMRKLYALTQHKTTSYLTDPQAPELPQEKTFFIDHFSVAGVPLKGLYLKFWNDTLYEIQCEASPEIKEAMILKYGDGSLKEERKDVTCTTRLGTRFTEHEVSYKTTWPAADPDIDVVYYIGKYFDYQCKPSYISYFTVSNRPLDIAIGKSEAAQKTKSDAEKDAEKKKKLADF